MEIIPNAPLGLWPDLQYEGEEIDTIKGRPLFVYTDGLTEAENSRQEQFGNERLLHIHLNECSGVGKQCSRVKNDTKMCSLEVETFEANAPACGRSVDGSSIAHEDMQVGIGQ